MLTEVKTEIKLTQKQENFTLNLFRDVPQNAAWGNAGYSTKYSPQVIAVNASRLANSTKVQLRLAELRAEAASSAVMNRQELLETHTEIARGRVGNFLDESQRIKQGANLTDASIQELDISDVKIGRGENAKLAQVTKIKLSDPVKSMQEIARLQGYYPKEGTGEDSQDNRAIYFIISGEKGQDLIEGITKRLKNATEG